MLRNPVKTLYGAYAAAMFIVLVLLLLCPLLIAAPTLRLRRHIGRFAVRAWAAACFMPFRVRGLAHLPAGPCIAVCNHASYLDGILLTAALPERFTFLVQHGAEAWPYIGLVLKRMGCCFVNRGSARAAALTTRELLARVAAGESLAIFPEGTFKQAPALLPFQSGAFLIATRAGVPVVPCVLRGSRIIFGEGSTMLRWQPIEIDFQAPLRANGDSREAVNALRDQARAIVLAHCGEADGLSLARDSASPDGSLVDAES